MKKILIIFSIGLISCSESNDVKIKYQVEQNGQVENVVGEIKRYNNGCISYEYNCGCLSNSVKSVTVCGTYKIIEQK